MQRDPTANGDTNRSSECASEPGSRAVPTPTGSTRAAATERRPTKRLLSVQTQRPRRSPSHGWSPDRLFASVLVLIVLATPWASATKLQLSFRVIFDHFMAPFCLCIPALAKVGPQLARERKRARLELPANKPTAFCIPRTYRAAASIDPPGQTLFLLLLFLCPSFLRLAPVHAPPSRLERCRLAWLLHERAEVVHYILGTTTVY